MNVQKGALQVHSGDCSCTGAQIMREFLRLRKSGTGAQNTWFLLYSARLSVCPDSCCVLLHQCFQNDSTQCYSDMTLTISFYSQKSPSISEPRVLRQKSSRDCVCAYSTFQLLLGCLMYYQGCLPNPIHSCQEHLLLLLLHKLETKVLRASTKECHENGFAAIFLSSVLVRVCCPGSVGNDTDILYCGRYQEDQTSKDSKIQMCRACYVQGILCLFRVSE